jgi:hypothetical protein
MYYFLVNKKAATNRGFDFKVGFALIEQCKFE